MPLLLFVVLNIEAPKVSTSINNKSSEIIFDADLLKNVIQNTVLDFIEDIELNPDSCYIPFKK